MEVDNAVSKSFHRKSMISQCFSESTRNFRKMESTKISRNHRKLLSLNSLSEENDADHNEMWIGKSDQENFNLMRKGHNSSIGAFLRKSLKKRQKSTVSSPQFSQSEKGNEGHIDFYPTRRSRSIRDRKVNLVISQSPMKVSAIASLVILLYKFTTKPLLLLTKY